MKCGDLYLTEALDCQHDRADPFAAAIGATQMAMVMTDAGRPDHPIVYCNAAFERLSGFSRDEIVGRNCRFMQGPDTDPAALARIRDAVQAGEAIEIDLLNYRKDGSTFWNALYLTPVRDEGGTIRFFFASQLDVTERVEAKRLIGEQKAHVEREVERRTADLQAALEAKTLLLHEVDHRVKNNLTMIGSLLRLQARTIDDPAITATLDAMLERVDALAGVHRQLYRSTDICNFDVAAFATALAADVLGASGRDDVTLRSDVERLVVPSSHASVLGLVLNEIVTNTIRHAFADGRAGTLTVRTRSEGPCPQVEVCDDGAGMATPAPGRGVGIALIRRLSRQIGAQAAWRDTEPGTCVTLTLSSEGTA